MALHLAAVFAFLLATLAVTSFAVPVKRSTWHQPCGKGVRTESNAGKVGVRHGVTKILKVVKHQIGIANKYFRSENKSFNATYYQVSEMNETSNGYDWLPQEELKWYNKSICSPRKANNVKKGLQRLHSALQNYSATFEELKKFRPDRNAHIRNNFIEGVAKQLTQVLCEVEWALECLKTTIPERVGEDFISKKKEWVNNPDTTSLLLQDWGVILRFQKFLKDWNRIVDLLNEKTVCKKTPKNNKTKKTKSRRKL